MTPRIIAYMQQDGITLYNSEEEAESSIEALDVKSGNWRFFDVQGNEFSVYYEVEPGTKKLAWLPFSTAEIGKFKLVEPAQNAAAVDNSKSKRELEEILRKFLLQKAHSKDLDAEVVADSNLANLIAMLGVVSDEC